MGELELKCRCGEVQARVRDASHETVNRLVCYCDDCQAYLHHLKRTDLLDEHGGTDIIQIAPCTLTFSQGMDRVEGVRLGPKGLYRWYASCCDTPVGNSMKPSLPFVGITAGVFDATMIDDVVGPPRGGIQGKCAVGTPPKGSTDLNLRFLVHAIRLVLGWKIRGKAWPHPFFDRTPQPRAKVVRVLTKEERDALRPLCGPVASSIHTRDGAAMA